MSEEYTPTTEQVRATYLGGTLIEFREEGFGRFQRWLAEVERAAAEKAWDEGYWQGINGYTGPGNPYRAEAYRQERENNE